ncbi:hypothetical protein Q1695_010481 [Nippostrongylus brasiliensis]|nr:hypothetical protein Q1695_010481 [Nippostrongylus brasiliensis]
MSNPDNTSKGLQLDAFTNGDDIGPWFAVRNSVIRRSLHNVDNTVEADFVPYRYEIGSKLLQISVRNSVIRRSLHNVDNTVEADFVPYRYEIGSKLRKALNEIDRRDSGKMSAKSKL